MRRLRPWIPTPLADLALTRKAANDSGPDSPYFEQVSRPIMIVLISLRQCSTPPCFLIGGLHIMTLLRIRLGLIWNITLTLILIWLLATGHTLTLVMEYVQRMCPPSERPPDHTYWGCGKPGQLRRDCPSDRPKTRCPCCNQGFH